MRAQKQTVTINKPTPNFFTGRVPFLSPDQQRQSTEGKTTGQIIWRKIKQGLKRLPRRLRSAVRQCQLQFTQPACQWHDSREWQIALDKGHYIRRRSSSYSVVGTLSCRCQSQFHTSYSQSQSRTLTQSVDALINPAPTAMHAVSVNRQRQQLCRLIWTTNTGLNIIIHSCQLDAMGKLHYSDCQQLA